LVNVLDISEVADKSVVSESVGFHDRMTVHISLGYVDRLNLNCRVTVHAELCVN